MKYLMNFMFVIVVLGTNIAFANTVSNKKISKVHVNIGAGYYFQTSDAMIDPESCGSTGWYKLKSSTYSKEAFSIILAAKMSGKPVTFYLLGCSGNYPKVEWLNVHN